MTSGFILYLPDKPSYKESIHLPNDGFNVGFLKRSLGYHSTKYEKIKYYGYASKYGQGNCGDIEYLGWFKADDCIEIRNWLGKHFWNKLGVNKDGCFLTAKNFSSPDIELYGALWIANLNNVVYKVFFSYGYGETFLDITENTNDMLRKIENLNNSTNPIVNSEAIIVFKNGARKNRFIALEKKPEKEESLWRI